MSLKSDDQAAEKISHFNYLGNDIIHDKDRYIHNKLHKCQWHDK